MKPKGRLRFNAYVNRPVHDLRNQPPRLDSHPFSQVAKFPAHLLASPVPKIDESSSGLSLTVKNVCVPGLIRL
jgi:hypothetical protein